MAIWAYECRPPGGSAIWFVSRERVDEWPAEVTVLRVKVGADWRCAVVDRGRALDVETILVREAVASDAVDCPECSPPPPAAEPEAGGQKAAAESLQAAAVSIQGRRMLVVLAPLDLVRSAGEAGMLSADLRARFGGIDIVLMGQEDDGSPHYHGDTALVAMLTGVPVERMPWKSYPIS